MRALCLLPDGPNYRKADFLAGLAVAGLKVVQELPNPGAGDVLILWTRGSWRDAEARRFEAAGATVLVAENGYMGKVWRDQKWFALAVGHHAGAGTWPDAGPQRWDGWGVELSPWRDGGTDIVILEQRGIGEPGIASPDRWAEKVQKRIGGRIRKHPGASIPAVSLRDDLANASCAVTWHSGAALQALLMGVPVFYDFPQWIGATAARPLAEFDKGPAHGDRLTLFRKAAWAMWTAEEIRSGVAFETILRR